MSKLRDQKEAIVQQLTDWVLPRLLDTGTTDVDDMVIEIFLDDGYLLDREGGGDDVYPSERDKLIYQWTTTHPEWLEFLIKQTYMCNYGRGIMKGIDDTTRGVVRGIRSAGYEL